MKKQLLFVGMLILSAVIITGCGGAGEVNPNGNNGGDNIPTAFTKKVVVEKFTGEWCGSCPPSSMFFDAMADKHGSKFIGVGIHAGSGADRYKDNQACKDMYNFHWRVTNKPGNTSVGFPNVMFNRGKSLMTQTVFNGYKNSEWEGQLNKELAKPAKCGLAITSKVEGTNLVVNVSYHLKEALDGEHAVTVLVLENGLDGSKQVSAQQPFTHNHVLRGLLTNDNGYLIDGSVVGKTESFEANDFDISAYNKDNLEVVAFLHKNGTSFDDNEILNGQIAHDGETVDFD
jgi:hypothetical protein